MRLALYAFTMALLLVCSRAIAVEGGVVTPLPGVARVAESAEWLALLHYQKGASQIQDQSFFLAADGMTNPVAELEATVAALMAGGDAACRFPARKAFVEDTLPEVGRRFPKVRCTALEEYLVKVPAEKVSLAFATEYIPNPTTMMGHLFLKIEGQRGATNPAHALTFFANLNKVRSTAEFIVGSLFTGTEGVYILEPYRDRSESYLVEGQRSIWDYELKLSAAERARLVRHIWEMKGINVSYDLKDNNCGTAILRLLMAAKPEMGVTQYKSFMTPADLLRALDERGDLAAGRFTASELHKVRHQGEVSPTASVLGKSHAASFKADFVNDSGDGFLRLGVAPAYNDLMSRNDYAESEYEVNLFKAEVGVSRALDKVNLQRLDVIGFQSYLPVTAGDASLSRAFRAGVENEGYGMATGKVFPIVSGGAGYTVGALDGAVNGFGMVQGGYAYYRRENVFTAAPEVGVIVKEGKVGKLVASYAHSFNSEDFKYRDKTSVRQSFFMAKDVNLNLEYLHVRPDRGESYRATSIGIGIFY